MNYWRCKCGETAYFESGMPPKDCQGCEICNTTLSFHPDYHKELKPHNWVVVYDRYTGEHIEYICTECNAKKRNYGRLNTRNSL